MPIPRALFAALAVTAALVVGAPAAGASALPAWSSPAWPQGTPAFGGDLPGVGNSSNVGSACTSATSDGQGRTGGTQTHVCTGAGLTFIGPAVGQIATVIGPTIISPSVVMGASVVSAGNVAIGP
jgi:hypothetical protein